MPREEVTLDVEIEELEEAKAGLFKKAAGAVRSSMMVGMGTVDLTQEKVMDLWGKALKFIGDLEGRGEKFSEKRREQVNDEVDKRQGQIKELRGKATESFDKYSEVVLTHVNIPTSEDIEGLSKQVSSLSRKVDKVNKEQKPAA
ncbi:MAG: phasin family protein [Candidatus Promineifilaceae bacterium]